MMALVAAMRLRKLPQPLPMMLLHPLLLGANRGEGNEEAASLPRSLLLPLHK
jgi:hypothetical protein